MLRRRCIRAMSKYIIVTYEIANEISNEDFVDELEFYLPENANIIAYARSENA